MVEPLEDGLSLVAAAVANAPDAISVFREGAKGRLELVYVNRAFERDTGWTRDEAQAHGAEFFTPSLAKRLIAGETLRRETSLPRKSGDPYPVTVTAWPTSLSNGERYFILLAGDPDEGRRMAQRLAAHSERLRQLHVVALSSGRTAERQIDAFLEFGTQVFGLDIAFAGPIAD
ncbi:MAG: PAS domain S-box protein, partial [Candidatus Eremiobacteraeota bacterium]|nr:PAS domain S-box protein [Candidatus Eremiobacteraeota bacterium]